jgi:hypothetical protein
MFNEWKGRTQIRYFFVINEIKFGLFEITMSLGAIMSRQVIVSKNNWYNGETVLPIKTELPILTKRWNLCFAMVSQEQLAKYFYGERRKPSSWGTTQVV